jgi:hypothetical protein
MGDSEFRSTLLEILDRDCFLGLQDMEVKFGLLGITIFGYFGV